MGSTFGSFEIGRRGIHVMQKGSQVAGQNIANANTPGYSRQIMNLKALRPPAVPGVETPPGYGVDVAAINRIKSEFYSNQILQSLTARDYWSQLGETLAALEVIFLEPGDTGINTYLSEFFDAWQEVSVNPESYAARVNLVEQADTLSGVVREMYGRLEDMFIDTEKEINDCITEINVLAEEIANLNKQIVFHEALGKVSNELLDERDLRIQELSELIDIKVLQKENGAVEIMAGGRTLLHDDLFFPLEKVIVFNEETREREFSIQNNFKFKVNPLGGKLQGLLETFNEVLPFYRAAMDDLAYHLVREVNRVHREGFGLEGSTGLNFFEPWEDPMPGDVIISGFEADPGGNITSLGFPPGIPDSRKLLDGEYRLETEVGYNGVSTAETVSSYSRNGQALVSGVDVAVDNELNSSIFFEVTKLDGEDIYLHYSYIHTKVNGDGELQTNADEGIKKLKAGDNAGVAFGSGDGWTLELNITLEDILNFSEGDKFIIQVSAAGSGSDRIRLESTDGVKAVYAITAASGAFEGEQELQFFQLDESTGEHRKVSLIIGVNGLTTADAAVFTVGPFQPEHPREYIYQAAANLKVNPYLIENKDAVAAAGKDRAPGDGANALEIARLREKLIEGLGNTTFEDFFRGLMVDLGVQGREAQRLEYNMNAIYENMAEQAEAVSGVSLDDEMLSMIQFQHSYNAAAKFLSIIDQMLETLINEIR